MSHQIDLRLMAPTDTTALVDAFQQADWLKPESLFEKYLAQQQERQCLIWVVQCDAQYAGYVRLQWHSQYKPFVEAQIPEIMDLNILPHFRKRGLGAALLDTAENAARVRGNIVGLGVGLYGGADGGYGAAQRLYVRRGYLPDGKGATYQYMPAVPGERFPLDDDLVLWFTKTLG